MINFIEKNISTILIIIYTLISFLIFINNPLIIWGDEYQHIKFIDFFYNKLINLEIIDILTHQRPPLVYLISGLFKVEGENEIVSLRILIIFINFLSFYYFNKIILLFDRSIFFQLIFSFLFLTNWHFLYNSGIYHIESFLILNLLVNIYFYIKYITTNKLKYFFLSTIFLFSGLLVKFNYIIYIAIIYLHILFLFIKDIKIKIIKINNNKFIISLIFLLLIMNFIYYSHTFFGSSTILESYLSLSKQGILVHNESFLDEILKKNNTSIIFVFLNICLIFLLFKEKIYNDQIVIVFLSSILFASILLFQLSLDIIRYEFYEIVTLVLFIYILSKSNYFWKRIFLTLSIFIIFFNISQYFNSTISNKNFFKKILNHNNKISWLIPYKKNLYINNDIGREIIKIKNEYKNDLDIFIFNHNQKGVHINAIRYYLDKQIISKFKILTKYQYNYEFENLLKEIFKKNLLIIGLDRKENFLSHRSELKRFLDEYYDLISIKFKNKIIIENKHTKIIILHNI